MYKLIYLVIACNMYLGPNAKELVLSDSWLPPAQPFIKDRTLLWDWTSGMMINHPLIMTVLYSVHKLCTILEPGYCNSCGVLMAFRCLDCLVCIYTMVQNYVGVFPWVILVELPSRRNRSRKTPDFPEDPNVVLLGLTFLRSSPWSNLSVRWFGCTSSPRP